MVKLASGMSCLLQGENKHRDQTYSNKNKKGLAAVDLWKDVNADSKNLIETVMEWEFGCLF